MSYPEHAIPILCKNVPFWDRHDTQAFHRIVREALQVIPHSIGSVNRTSLFQLDGIWWASVEWFLAKEGRTVNSGIIEVPVELLFPANLEVLLVMCM